MVSTLFFDLDDTLLWDKKSIQAAFEQACQSVPGCDEHQLEQAVRKAARELYQSYPTYSFTQMIGINPFEALWGTFDDPGDDFKMMYQLMPEYRVKAWSNGLKACGITDLSLATHLANRFIEERKKHPYVYSDTFSVLEQLKGKYQLLLLTNGSPSLQRTKLMITPEIEHYFDHIIISGEFGRGKPDPAIFEHALKQANTQPHEVIMIGDNLMTDILGAHRTGIKNIWINHHNQNAEDVTPTYQVKSLTEALTIINR